MAIRKILLGACAAVTVLSGTAWAQPDWVPPGNDPNGYYSQADHSGYYDRDGRYRRIRFGDRGNYGPPPPGPGYGPPPPPPPGYGPPPAQVRDCRSDNRATGTILGAIAGGLIGGFASHGNGLATVGGVIGGGVLGNVIAGDMDCEDQAQAYPIYVDALNGDIGRRYEWRHDRAYGYFTPVREFRRGDMRCREFTETSFTPDGRNFTRTGTACRQGDGNWRFD